MSDHRCPSVIEAHGLRFVYDVAPILENFDLRVCEGDFACVVGANGAGKSTFLKLCLGLLDVQTGSLQVLGRSPREARPLIGYVPQFALFDPQFPLRVRDVVRMGLLGPKRWWGAFSKGEKVAAEEALAEVELSDLSSRSFAELSGGQRQRVLIARALACRPRLLLLDEATSNLDAGVEERFYELLARLNETMTIVMVSHDLGFVSRIVKTVICIRRQAIVHPTSELTGDLVREIYGGDPRMIRHDHRCAEHDHGGHSCSSS